MWFLPTRMELFIRCIIVKLLTQEHIKECVIKRSQILGKAMKVYFKSYKILCSVLLSIFWSLDASFKNEFFIIVQSLCVSNECIPVLKICFNVTYTQSKSCHYRIYLVNYESQCECSSLEVSKVLHKCRIYLTICKYYHFPV